MSEPVAWRWVADHKYLCASEPEKSFAHQWEPLYSAESIERKDAAIAELVAALKDCAVAIGHIEITGLKVNPPTLSNTLALIAKYDTATKET